MGDEKSKPREADDFFINTAPEMDALERAAADGKHGCHYATNEQYGAMQHAVPGSTHSVWLELTDDEREPAQIGASMESAVAEGQGYGAANNMNWLAAALTHSLQLYCDKGSGHYGCGSAYCCDAT